ncbi:MAG: hypothetical protein WD017_03655 [Cucumibacter sp.]
MGPLEAASAITLALNAIRRVATMSRLQETFNWFEFTRRATCVSLGWSRMQRSIEVRERATKTFRAQKSSHESVDGFSLTLSRRIARQFRGLILHVATN